MAWLEASDLDDKKWTQVINDDGDVAGWIETRSADILNLDFHTVETPKRFIHDPFVRHHATIVNKMGLLKNQDLSEIQNVLLWTNIARDNDNEEALRVRTFEESMYVNNQELWKAYIEHKEQVEANSFDDEFEETTPDSIEDFFAALSAFTEGGPESNPESQDMGWLDALLDDDELSQMGD